MPFFTAASTPSAETHGDAQQHLLQAQTGRDGAFVVDDGLDGLALVDDGFAKITVGKAFHGDDVPLHHGLVQAVLGVHAPGHAVRQLFHTGGEGIAGGGCQQEEGGRGNDEEGKQHDDQPLYRIL